MISLSSRKRIILRLLASKPFFFFFFCLLFEIVPPEDIFGEHPSASRYRRLQGSPVASPLRTLLPIVEKEPEEAGGLPQREDIKVRTEIVENIEWAVSIPDDHGHSGGFRAFTTLLTDVQEYIRTKFVAL